MKDFVNLNNSIRPQDDYNEYVNVYANDTSIGSSARTGCQGNTLCTPSGWSNQTISSSLWSAGSLLTIRLYVSQYVHNSQYGGQNYVVTLTY